MKSSMTAATAHTGATLIVAQLSCRGLVPLPFDALNTTFESYFLSGALGASNFLVFVQTMRSNCVSHSSQMYS